MLSLSTIFFFFFFNDTATTEIYTLSLHDALPICTTTSKPALPSSCDPLRDFSLLGPLSLDRKSTRLNSSHSQISYAVFCLKKKKKHERHIHTTSNQYTDSSPASVQLISPSYS